MTDTQSIDSNLRLILNSLQLGVYTILLGMSIFKLVKSVKNSLPFLVRFYSAIIFTILLQIGIQGYQIAMEAQGRTAQNYIFVIINLYAITGEGLAILFMADYWGETKEIITKQSTEFEISENRHYSRYVVVTLWLMGFTAFVVYSLIDDHLLSSDILRMTLALGCQGFASAFVLLAIIKQIITGNGLARALGRYEQWLNHIAIRKIQFRCLYWITSFLNGLRILYLITLTIMIEIDDTLIQETWLSIYIYTFSNCVVILIYTFGFSTQNQQDYKFSTLLEKEN